VVVRRGGRYLLLGGVRGGGGVGARGCLRGAPSGARRALTEHAVERRPDLVFQRPIALARPLGAGGRSTGLETVDVATVLAPGDGATRATVGDRLGSVTAFAGEFHGEPRRNSDASRGEDPTGGALP